MGEELIQKAYEINKRVKKCLLNEMFIPNTEKRKGKYVFVGGVNNRDWATLISVSKEMKDIKFVIVSGKSNISYQGEYENIKFYEGINNEQGILSISRTALIDSLVKMYSLTKETMYLDNAAFQLRDIYKLLEEKKKDYQGEIRTSWIYELGSTGEYAYLPFHAGMVALSTLKYAQLVKDENLDKYNKEAEIFVEKAFDALMSFEREFDEEYQAYRWNNTLPTNESFSLGCLTSTNEQLVISLAWAYLGDYFNVEDYDDRFYVPLKTFRDGTYDTQKNNRWCPGIEKREGYYWWYYDPFLPQENRIDEDGLHFYWILEACLYDIKREQKVFNKDDLIFFGASIDQFIVDENQNPPLINRYMDKVSYEDKYKMFFHGWLRNAYFVDIYNEIPNWSNRSLKVAEYYFHELWMELENYGVEDKGRVDSFSSIPYMLNYMVHKMEVINDISQKI